MNEDTYDGMNPSDNPKGATALPDVEAEIVQPAIERAVYAVLTVWPRTNESDVFSWGDGSKSDNTKRVSEFNAAGNSGTAYLIRVPLPPAK